MKDNLKQAVEFLKRRVQYNLQIIRHNEQMVRNILKEPVSTERSEKLDEKLKMNKQIIQENQDSLKIQLSIIQFLDKYKQELKGYSYIENITYELQQAEGTLNERTDEQELTREDYFHLTANKGIAFDRQHPYYSDREFLNDLMQHFIDVEDYEMCSKLNTVKSVKNTSE